MIWFLLMKTKAFFTNEAGDLLTTNDGGITWEIIKYYAEHSIEEIKFLDQLNGFGFINKIFFQQGDVPFIYTTDAGGIMERSSDFNVRCYHFSPPLNYSYN